MGRGRSHTTRTRRRLIPGILGLVVLLTACGPGVPTRQAQITLVTDTPTPVPSSDAPAVLSTPSAMATVALAGSFRVAATPAAQQQLQPIMASLAAIDPKLKLTVSVVPDADTATASGADFGLVQRLPGAPLPAGGMTVNREPITLMLPLTLSPDDLTLAQVVDLVTGAVTDWSQVGGPHRSVRLAFSDPTQLAAIGGLAGKPGARVAAARSDAAPTLLQEVDAGNDEVVVVPWSGPRLHSKALRIDRRYPENGDYPLTLDLVLVPVNGTTEMQQPAAQLASAFARALAPPKDGTVTLDAVGDLMLARGIATAVQRNGADWPFAKVSDRLRTADLRFGNLEVALTDRGVQAHKDYTFRAPPSATQTLSSAGMNVVDLANNHVLDYGGQGLLDTIGALSSAGILHTGAGADGETAHAPVIVEVNGLRIAWLAYANVPDDSVTGFVARSLEAGPGRPGVAWGTADAIRRDVAAARQHADVVIVALHSGFEYTSDPNSIQRDLAHTAIDAGAALVLGAHPHVLQGIEYYKGGVIAYSLGNFVFDLDESDRAHLGLPSVLTIILRVALDAHGVTGLEVYPAIINSTDFRPEPVYGDAAQPVYDRLYRLTDALKAKP